VSNDLDAYEGRWVAMRDGKVVADGGDEDAVREHPDVVKTDLVFPIGEPPSGFYLINV
jgi:Family of unknown function (DUF5678)